MPASGKGTSFHATFTLAMKPAAADRIDSLADERDEGMKGGLVYEVTPV
jgi:hypothetical protein